MVNEERFKIFDRQATLGADIVLMKDLLLTLVFGVSTKLNMMPFAHRVSAERFIYEILANLKQNNSFEDSLSSSGSLDIAKVKVFKELSGNFLGLKLDELEAMSLLQLDLMFQKAKMVLNPLKLASLPTSAAATELGHGIASINQKIDLANFLLKFGKLSSTSRTNVETHLADLCHTQAFLQQLLLNLISDGTGSLASIETITQLVVQATQARLSNIADNGEIGAHLSPVELLDGDMMTLFAEVLCVHADLNRKQIKNASVEDIQALLHTKDIKLDFVGLCGAPAARVARLLAKQIRQNLIEGKSLNLLSKSVHSATESSQMKAIERRLSILDLICSCLLATLINGKLETCAQYEDRLAVHEQAERLAANLDQPIQDVFSIRSADTVDAKLLATFQMFITESTGLPRDAPLSEISAKLTDLGAPGNLLEQISGLTQNKAAILLKSVIVQIREHGEWLQQFNFSGDDQQIADVMIESAGPNRALFHTILHCLIAGGKQTFNEMDYIQKIEYRIAQSKVKAENLFQQDLTLDTTKTLDKSMLKTLGKMLSSGVGVDVKKDEFPAALQEVAIAPDLFTRLSESTPQAAVVLLGVQLARNTAEIEMYTALLRKVKSGDASPALRSAMKQINFSIKHLSNNIRRMLNFMLLTVVAGKSRTATEKTSVEKRLEDAGVLKHYQNEATDILLAEPVEIKLDEEKLVPPSVVEALKELVADQLRVSREELSALSANEYWNLCSSQGLDPDLLPKMSGTQGKCALEIGRALAKLMESFTQVQHLASQKFPKLEKLELITLVRRLGGMEILLCDMLATVVNGFKTRLLGADATLAELRVQQRYAQSMSARAIAADTASRRKAVDEELITKMKELTGVRLGYSSDDLKSITPTQLHEKLIERGAIVKDIFNKIEQCSRGELADRRFRQLRGRAAPEAIYIYICIHIHTYVYIYIYIYIYMCVCMYIYIYIYTHV